VGCQGMLIVTTIFAGFTGTIVALVVALTEKSTWLQVCLGLLMLALLLFAHAAEQITDALDEGDVFSYLQSMLEYNIGVVLFLLSLGAFLYSRGYQLLALIPLVGTIDPWLRDIYWFVFRRETEYQTYVDDLRKVM
jgi:hypothetical protein